MVPVSPWVFSAMISVAQLHSIAHRYGVTLLVCVLLGAYWAMQAGAATGASVA